MVDFPFFGSGPDSSWEPRLEEYWSQLKDTWEDGYISAEEEMELEDARRRLNITPAEHEQLLKKAHLTVKDVRQLQNEGDVIGLLIGLSSADAELHGACFNALRGMRLKQIKGELLQALDDDSATWRRRAALEVIASRPFKEAKEKVVAAFDDKNKFVRRSAAAALTGIISKFHDLNLANKAVETLTDEDAVVRRHAVESLRFMLDVKDKDYEEIVAQQLVEAIDDGNAFVRRHALEIFEKMGEKALQPLIDRGLTDDDCNTRRTAMDAVGRLNTDQSIPHLIDGLRAKDRYLRWHAAKSLGKFPDDDRAREALIEALSDDDAYIRRRAARSLAHHGEPAVERLLELTRFGLPKTQRNAWRALSLIEGNEELKEPFIQGLEHPEARIRQWAAQGLARCGDFSDDVLYALKRSAAEDDEEAPRKAAKAALETLEEAMLKAETREAKETMDNTSAPAPEELGEEALSASGMV